MLSTSFVALSWTFSISFWSSLYLGFQMTFIFYECPFQECTWLFFWFSWEVHNRSFVRFLAGAMCIWNLSSWFIAPNGVVMIRFRPKLEGMYFASIEVKLPALGQFVRGIDTILKYGSVTGLIECSVYFRIVCKYLNCVRYLNFWRKEQTG